MNCIPGSYRALPLPMLAHCRRASLGFATAVTVTLLAAGGVGAVEVDAEVLAALRREIAELRARVRELERQQAHSLPGVATDSATVVRNAPAPAAPPTPALASVPGTAVSVGGRLKLDVIGNSASVGGAGGSNTADFALNPGAIPLSGAGASDQLSFSAHGARVWLKALQPSAWGDAAALVEIDFFSRNAGDERVSNSYTPRLRHAYGEWRGWTVGQTYTTFMNASAFPELNDDGIPAGLVLVRQPMIRKSFALGAGRFEIAAESPETTLGAADGSRFAPDDDRMPDWIVRYGRRGDFGNLSLAAMVRELRVDDAVASGLDDTALGYALSLSGRIHIAQRDDLRFALSGGNALGRYMSANAFNDARPQTSGRLELNPSLGGFAAYRHQWSTRWRSNLLFGSAWQSGAGAAPSENEWLASVHANLLFSPLSSTTVGIEWIHARRRRFDGAAGHLDRLQFTALHTF